MAGTGAARFQESFTIPAMGAGTACVVLAAADATAVRDAAHHLRTSSRAVGAFVLADVLGRIETAAPGAGAGTGRAVTPGLDAPLAATHQGMPPDQAGS